mmetsp:Transcript_1366/g.3161  ORF Transcript_1366/g.3161 Transcript_1366/m.3161 type:complete len:325 (-) Transcript_1366:354-1328(-)
MGLLILAFHRDPATSILGIIHPSPCSFSIHAARFSSMREVSSGMNLLMRVSLSFMVRVSCRIVSSMSLRSVPNSSCRSLASLSAAWYRPHSFLSFFVFTSTSSCREEKCSSSCRFASSFSASSLASTASCTCLSRSSVSAWRRAASCFEALEITSPPFISFSSMAFSCSASLRFWLKSSLRSTASWSSAACSSARSLAVVLAWSISAFISCCACFISTSFSSSAFLRITAISSSVTPTRTSRNTSLSTIFSTISRCALVIITSLPSSPIITPLCVDSSWSLSALIWSWYSLNMASLGSSLILGLFLIFLARFAYLRVEIVSSKL